MVRFRATLRPLILRFSQPLTTARTTYLERVGWQVALRAEDGMRGQVGGGGVLEGWGEAMPLPDFGTETVEACGATLAAWVDGLLEVPEHPAALAEWLMPLEATPAARHALEQAALVLQALRAGVPLARWLAEHFPGELGMHPPRASVPVHALLTGIAPAELAEQGRQAVANGFTTLKVKVGARSLAEDEARLWALRGAVPPGVRLRVDANGAWDVRGARVALGQLGGVGLELCEQPVPPGDVEGLAALRGTVPCAVAADEAVASRQGAHQVLAQEAADVLVLKPMVLGGLLPALAVAHEAERARVSVYLTSSLDGPVARAGAAHLSAMLPLRSMTPPLASGIAVGHLFANEPVHPYSPREGAIWLPELPGLGFAPMPPEGM